MPANKYRPERDKHRELVFLRVFGTLGLLVGTALGLVALIVPGAPIVGIPILMTVSAGMIGVYAGVNFLFGVSSDLWKLGRHYSQEREALYEYWLKKTGQEKLGFFRRIPSRLRYIVFPALTESLFHLSSRTKEVLDELSDNVIPHVEELSRLSKLKRLSDLVGKIRLIIFPKRNPDHEFKKVEKEFYGRLYTLHNAEYNSFEEAMANNPDLNRTELLKQLSENQNVATAAEPKIPSSHSLEAKIEAAEDTSREGVFLRTFGNLFLAVGLTMTILASFSVPGLPLAVIPIVTGVGAGMVVIYASWNFFAVDTLTSLRNISRQYFREREIVFQFWHNENLESSNFSARMQLIYFPAFLHALVDLVSNLQKALTESESSEKFSELPKKKQLSRLLNLVKKVQDGWAKALGKPNNMRDFDEKEKILSGLLLEMGYPSFEDGVKKIGSRNELIKLLKEKYKKFNEDFEKISDKNSRNKLIENNYRRFKAYQRAIDNLTQELLKITPTQSKEEAKSHATYRINKKHRLGVFEDHIKKFIDLDELESPESDRKAPYLKVIGSFGLAVGIVLSMISSTIPGLPLIVIPALMGTSAMMVLTYVTVNFISDMQNAIQNTAKLYFDEKQPLLEVWLQSQDIKPFTFKSFYLRFMNIYGPAILDVIREIFPKAQDLMSNITEHSGDLTLPKTSTTEQKQESKIIKAYKESVKVRGKYNIFSKELDKYNKEDSSVDQKKEVPEESSKPTSNFDTAEQTLKGILKNMGYNSFQEALKDYKNKSQTITDLNNYLLNSLKNPEKNEGELVQQKIDVKEKTEEESKLLNNKKKPIAHQSTRSSLASDDDQKSSTPLNQSKRSSLIGHPPKKALPLAPPSTPRSHTPRSQP